MRSMRVAVWGLGRHAINRILPAVSAAGRLELYGVCSRNSQSVSTCSQMWNCDGWTDATSMLRDPQVDIVYVATPIGLHAEHGMRVLDAGKHLWCEKPLSCRLQDTMALLERSRNRGLAVCEGFMYLYHPHFLALLGYLAEGRLGSIRSIGCQFGIPGLEHPGFRTDPALGGGALLDVGCYPVSAIEALFPEQSPYVAYARIATEDGSAVDTDGDAVIVMPNGVVAHLEWRINCSYRNRLDIWGEKGSVFSDKIFSKPANHVPVFHFRDTHGAETTEYGEANDHFSSMLRSFGGMVDDVQLAEAERRRIVRRAEMLDRIWTASRGGT